MSLILPVLFLARVISCSAPDSRLTPDQVVRIVATALRNNNSPIPNAGIFTAYRFASPANHAVTGPYGRFLRTVKTPVFAPIFAHDFEEFGVIITDHDRAWQTMRIQTTSGKAIEYRWDLSLQKEKTYRGCWMVDGVSRVP